MREKQPQDAVQECHKKNIRKSHSSVQPDDIN